MRIAVVGDIHIGAGLPFASFFSSSYEARRAYQRARFRSLQVLNQRTKEHFTIFLGDIFHHFAGGNIAVYLSSFHQIFGNREAPSLIVAGNHDWSGQGFWGGMPLPEDVEVIIEPTYKTEPFYAIFLPYLPNEEESLSFLLDVPPAKKAYVFSHLSLWPDSPPLGVFDGVKWIRENRHRIPIEKIFWINGHIHIPSSFSPTEGIHIINLGAWLPSSFGDTVLDGGNLRISPTPRIAWVSSLDGIRAPEIEIVKEAQTFLLATGKKEDIPHLLQHLDEGREIFFWLQEKEIEQEERKILEDRGIWLRIHLPLSGVKSRDDIQPLKPSLSGAMIDLYKIFKDDPLVLDFVKRYTPRYLDLSEMEI